MSRQTMVTETHGQHEDVQPALFLSVAGLITLLLVAVNILAAIVSLGLGVAGVYFAQRAISDDASIPLGGYSNIGTARFARVMAWVSVVGSVLIIVLFLWNVVLPSMGVGSNAY